MTTSVSDATKRSGGDLEPNTKSSVTFESPLKKNAKLSSSPERSPVVQASPGKRVDLEARALNVVLENCLLITLRPEAAVSPIVFVGGDERTDSLITANNISELVCSRLSGTCNEILNAVSYLVGCCKRMIAKEPASNQKTREELMK